MAVIDPLLAIVSLVAVRASEPELDEENDADGLTEAERLALDTAWRVYGVEES